MPPARLSTPSHAEGLPARGFPRSGLAILAPRSARSAVGLGLLALTLLVVAGCEAAPSALDPRGVRAARIADLSWFLFIVAGVIYLVVLALLAIAVFRRRDRTEGDGHAPGGVWFVVAGGILVPAVVLIGTNAYTLYTTSALAAPPDPDELSVRVIGHMWWWEIHYPEQGFTTANEIHIPVGRPVRLEVSSADVIHSFWVPQLMGKIDLIPGRVNEWWLQADEPGIYRGQCAEFCGIQHAKMAFLVVAEPPEVFAEWLVAQQLPAEPPRTPLAQRGAQAFAQYGCITCHTIRYGPPGVGGEFGPDLTHFGSRLTIAAGTLPNTEGHLGGWIADPQAIKPGNNMPDVDPDPVALRALVEYLMSLE